MHSLKTCHPLYETRAASREESGHGVLSPTKESLTFLFFMMLVLK